MKPIILALLLGVIPSLTGCQRNREPSATQDFPPDIVAAVSRFKTNGESRYQNDYAIPRRLIPLIKKGMTPAEVTAILGQPNEKKAVGDQTSWFYGLFYSQSINIRFNSEGTVVNVQSTVTQREDMPNQNLERTR